MSKPRTDHPFKFEALWSMVELTGLSARTLSELVEHIKTVPGSVIYYHTHHFLKQHQALSPEPPNDFAYWVTNVMGNEVLGERLASIDTVRYPSIRALRDKFVDIIESYLKSSREIRTAPEGGEFWFMKSKSFIVPTPYEARDLHEFSEAIAKVSVYTLYYHIFESRLRLERGRNDFSNWLETELEEKSLALAISRMDPYTQSLENLRAQILRLVEDRIWAHQNGEGHAS